MAPKAGDRGTARLLDLTRLVSRLGRGPLTGIDRVEYAYLTALLADAAPAFGLVRTGLGYVLLDRPGMAALADLVAGHTAPGRAGWLARLARRGDPLRARAEAAVRRLALARAPTSLLGRMLRRHLPAGTSYLNVGHANLSHQMMTAARALGGRVAVLVHDVIPLDYPEYTRPGIAEVFSRKMQAVAQGADLVIHSTHAARARTEAHLARLGRVPPGVVAALGVPVPVPDPSALPKGLMPDGVYFVALGTIEPRKNHALLLDVWDTFTGPQVPRLFILGGRGWSNAAVFARLDAQAARKGPVVELPGLSDGAVAALLTGARALLFPSHAEGFGLPPIEAAALGVPVLAADLPELREMLGDFAVYLSATDRYSWGDAVEKLAGSPGPSHRRRRIDPPTWNDHFRIVLSFV